MRKDDLPELPELEGLDELEELPEPEELPELEELEPVEATSPRPSPHPPAHEIEPVEPRGFTPKEQPELAPAELRELEELPAVPAESRSAAEPPPDAAAGPRELERAPMMLQKAAALLALAALLPWLVPSEDGSFPVERTLAKLVVLLGGWVFYLGVKHRHGEAVPGPFARLGAAHKSALSMLGGLIMAVGIAPLIEAGGMREVVAKAAVAVGVIVWCQVQDYAKGGRFNPMLGMVIPMFGLGGLGRLVTVFRQFDALALVGSLGVTVAGALAGYTMVVAMREAKEHGKRKKQAAMEARKRERKAKANR